MVLFSINGVGAHTARAPLFNHCVGARGRAANHPKIATIRALYRDPMPLTENKEGPLCRLRPIMPVYQCGKDMYTCRLE